MATTKKITKKTTTKKVVLPRAPKKKVEASVVGETQIFSMAGKAVGTIAMPVELFGRPWKADLVHQVSTAMQANARQNRAHTKDRAEVAGGGKKPWKQKGTGQARHGSTRSPIWRHGGVTFGPRKERDYSEKINRKAKVAALLTVLSRKAKEGEIVLVDKLSFAVPSTAEAKKALTAIANGSDAKYLMSKKNNSALIALASYDAASVKSFRNLGNVMTEEIRNLNPVDLLTYKYLVIVDPASSFAVLSARAKK